MLLQPRQERQNLNLKLDGNANTAAFSTRQFCNSAGRSGTWRTDECIVHYSRISSLVISEIQSDLDLIFSQEDVQNSVDYMKKKKSNLELI